MARRRGLLGLIVPALFAAAALTVLIGLGLWQLDRSVWKNGLIADLDRRMAEQPAPLPARETWGRLEPDFEFRRVEFSAELLNDQEALVYTSGSALRSDVKEPGYWVFTPARLPGGSLVVVNRGYVPEDKRDPKSRPEGQVPGVHDIVGIMRRPEQRGTFTPNDDPGRNLWFVRDHLAIAAAKSWGTVAPFLIDQESPQPPGGLPRAGPLKPNLPNNHMQYAVTWFGLAGVLVVMFGIWVRARLRAPREGG